jgi:hypothetical protein
MCAAFKNELEQIYQGMTLWCFSDGTKAGRESSRKSFAKECQKTYAAKTPQVNNKKNAMKKI